MHHESIRHDIVYDKLNHILKCNNCRLRLKILATEGGDIIPDGTYYEIIDSNRIAELIPQKAATESYKANTISCLGVPRDWDSYQIIAELN